MKEIEVSVVMPCLNEEQTIKICVEKALKAFKKFNIVGEVVVSDNGSTDNSCSLATACGARVVHQTLRGYGNAYLKGFAEAKGKYMLMADSDDTYDFMEMENFIQPLREGYDFVIGNRLNDQMKPGAMPWLHKHIGNPGLTAFLNFLFGTHIGDSHCGMRAFTKEAYEKMHLRTSGMEFASEMVIKAAEQKLKIKEVPITYYPREGSRSKLSSFRDGWRHVRFMLLYTPLHLFMIPGFLLSYFGALILAILLFGPVKIFGVELQTHPMLFGSMMLILGVQIAMFGLFTKVYRSAQELSGREKTGGFMNKYFTLEKGLQAGIGLTLIGALIAGLIAYQWVMSDFGTIQHLQYAILSFTLIMIGMQIVFSSFFISIISIKHT